MNTQGKILAVLQDESLWRAPSYSTLMKLTGLKSKNSVFQNIKKLQKEKLIDKRYKPI